MKKDDRLKPVAEKILNRISSGELINVYASTATLQEIIFWYFNRDMPSEMTTATNALTHLENVRWISLTPDICLTASMLINEYGITPFDAYHAATAISQDKRILSTDHVYDRIKGIERIEPEDLTRQP